MKCVDHGFVARARVAKVDDRALGDLEQSCADLQTPCEVAVLADPTSVAIAVKAAE